MQNSRGEKLRDIGSASEICSAAGFEYVDYSPDFKSDDWEERARCDRDILDRAGISVEQTHAPFNRYRQHDDAIFPTYCRRLFEASKILGAKYVVVHADEYRVFDHYDEKEILDFTYDYLAPHVEYAEKNGLIVAVENVFEDNSSRYAIIDGKSRYTSRVEELEAVIERFDSPSVRCCWDFGHAKCQYGKDKMADALEKVAKYVVCTHVHDNYYDKDLHLVPFLGDTDWDKNIHLLKNAKYDGKLSFELVYGEIQDDNAADFMRFVYSTGKKLCKIFDSDTQK